MSFTYYRKYDTPKYGVAEQADSGLALNPAKEGANQRDITKSVVKRKRRAKEEKLDLCFEFTPTHPGERRAEVGETAMRLGDEGGARNNSNLPLMKRASSKFEHMATQTRKPTQGEFVKENYVAREKSLLDKNFQMLEANNAKGQEAEGEKERDISSGHNLQDFSHYPPSIGGGKKKAVDSLDKSMDVKKRKLSSAIVPGEDSDLNTRKVHPCKNLETSGDKRLSKNHRAESGQPKQLLSPARIFLPDSRVSYQGSSNYDLIKNDRTSPMLRDPSPTTDDRRPSRKHGTSKIDGVYDKKAKSGNHVESSDLVKTNKLDRQRNNIHHTEKRKLVRLEDLSMSYWDFVYSHRCERIILSLSSKKPEWDPSYSLTLQSVYDKFICRVRKEFYPPPVVEANPENEQLMQVKEKYLRILKLLEHEKAELERSNAKLEELVNKSYSSHPKALSDAAEGDNKSQCAKVTKTHPDLEILLSDQERILLTTKPDVGQIDLSAFVGIQTKIDAVELWSKQIGMINNSFELKTSSISSIMRKYKIPDSPSSLLRAFSLNY
ncbi:uncharacterized protein LOC126323910 [Schistocerca gregaria]|uniref:uncharacterized protein LOC126323910 n=1 Tax=Schistocerca gregaria TaxID=7010 RepID=UPI00211DD265|nr:uncharacterized protein LOC126323910 [Schistocerca gregaria]